MTPPVQPMEGRHWRAVVGSFTIGAAVVQFLVRHAVLPLLTKTAPTVTVYDIGIAGAFLLIGWLLIDHDSFLEVFDKVKDRIPFLGSK